MHHRAFYLTVLLLLWLHAFPANAQDCINYDKYLSLLGSYEHPAWPTTHHGPVDMTYSGNNVFIASEGLGLITGQLSADGELEFLSRTPTWSEAKALFLMDNRMYIADGMAGLQVYDVSSAHAPQWLAHIDTPGAAMDVEAVPGRAFILDSVMGLVVINTEEVKSPRITATFPVAEHPKAMVRQGNTIMVASYSGVLSMIDISVPDSPVLIMAYEGGESWKKISLNGNMLMLVSNRGLVQFADISNPTSVEFQGRIDLIYQPFSVLLEDKIAIISMGHYGIFILSVEDANAPVIRTRYVSATNSIFAMSVVGDYLLAAGDEVDVLDFSNPLYPELLGSAELSSYYYYLSANENFAYLLDRDNGLATVDIRNAATPVVVSTDTLHFGYQTVIKDNFLYMSARSGLLELFSLENPALPVFHDSFPVQNNARHLDVFGDILCVMQEDYFSLLDISDPGNPQHLSTTSAENCYRGDIQGSKYYLVGGGVIEVWDISNPTTPILIATNSEATAPVRVTAEGDFLYVSDNYDPSFRIFDVTVPSEIHLVASLDFDSASVPILVKNDFAYVCDDDRLIQVVDVHDKINPRKLGTLSKSRHVDITFSSDKLLALGEYGDLDISQLQCAYISDIEPELHRLEHNVLNVYPNPFNPQTTIAWQNQKSQQLEVCIYDLAGRLVATVADRVFPSGECLLKWDGENNKGTPMPSGIYLISLRGEFVNNSQRICLIR